MKIILRIRTTDLSILHHQTTNWIVLDADTYKCQAFVVEQWCVFCLDVFAARLNDVGRASMVYRFRDVRSVTVINGLGDISIMLIVLNDRRLINYYQSTNQTLDYKISVQTNNAKKTRAFSMPQAPK